MRKLLIIFLLSCVTFAAFAVPKNKYFGTQLQQSKWQVQASKLSCSLNTEIDNYGELKFLRAAGEDEKSELTVKFNRAIDYEYAKILFTKPSWQQAKTLIGWDFILGENIKSGVKFSTRESRTILDAMQEGFVPIIKHKDNNNRTLNIETEISIIGFNQAFMEYSVCQQNLIPYSFDDIKVSTILFDTASTRIASEYQKLLSYILIYLQDPEIIKVELSGYTDSIGNFRENHKLASQRVDNVKQYLITAGINKDLLRLRVYGEQNAYSNNNSKEGRALNRRVTIKIYR